MLPAGAAAADAGAVPHYVWMEAEHFGPLRGGNFSFEQPAKTAKGSWAVAGPGVAAEWTQGGESEWMSIAARADETNMIVVSHDVEVPANGEYALWIRYADYRKRKDKRTRDGGGEGSTSGFAQAMVEAMAGVLEPVDL